MRLSAVGTAVGTAAVGGGGGEWAAGPRCLDIPRNLSLCADIGYRQMRLPNLLGHESAAEVGQQAAAWVPLLALACHPDTRLFLCALFAPVCLDRPIPPCRSLCRAVRTGCAARMAVYGYPWPDMLRCDRYPRDDGLCIAPQHGGGTSCSACKQADTFENLIDNFCRADFVIKTRIKKIQKTKLSCKKPKVIKIKNPALRKDLKRPIFKQENFTACCADVFAKAGRKGVLMIMGSLGTEGNLNAHFIMDWRKTPNFKNAVKMMKTIDCSDPKKISDAMLSDGIPKISGNKKRNQ